MHDDSAKARLGPILITAGPTWEPIDEVRFIGNRSSGRVGVAIARAAVSAGLETILLLGPGITAPLPTGVDLYRFDSSRDLESLLRTLWPDRARTLVMAAAVADFRGRSSDEGPSKIERTADGITLKLESTPDLVAACAWRKRPDQLVVGFALEQAAGLDERARAKLERKNLDAIVANPLQTMDAATIDATLMWRNGHCESTGVLDKIAFGEWLLDRLAARSAESR
ncbi:MAG: phosphopantothenoylcysteine decarboxylase [Phycisphaerales bacterium]